MKIKEIAQVFERTSFFYIIKNKYMNVCTHL